MQKSASFSGRSIIFPLIGPVGHSPNVLAPYHVEHIAEISWLQASLHNHASNSTIKLFFFKSGEIFILGPREVISTAR